MKTRYFLFGTLDTMCNYEEGKTTPESLDIFEVVAFEDQDLTEMLDYVVSYGYYVEIREEEFNNILTLS